MATASIRVHDKSLTSEGSKAHDSTPAHIIAAQEATRAWAASCAEGWAKAAKIAAGWQLISSFSCGYVPIEMWRSPQGLHVFLVQVRVLPQCVPSFDLNFPQKLICIDQVLTLPTAG